MSHNVGSYMSEIYVDWGILILKQERYNFIYLILGYVAELSTFFKKIHYSIFQYSIA